MLLGVGLAILGVGMLEIAVYKDEFPKNRGWVGGSLGVGRIITEKETKGHTCNPKILYEI